MIISYAFQRMPFCARLVNVTPNTRLVLSSHQAGRFGLTFYGDPDRNLSPLLFLGVDMAFKSLVTGNFSADSQMVPFRPLPDTLNNLALVEKGSLDEMLRLGFPSQHQMLVVSYKRGFSVKICIRHQAGIRKVCTTFWYSLMSHPLSSIFQISY